MVESVLGCDNIFAIPVKAIVKYYNPLLWPWDGSPPAQDYSHQDFLEMEPMVFGIARTTDEHLRRIASFVQNPTDDPILIEVYEGIVFVIDGNHRLYAAVIRESNAIQSGISGNIQEAEELFPL